jgi:hypothetical protein
MLAAIGEGVRRKNIRGGNANRFKNKNPAWTAQARKTGEGLRSVGAAPKSLEEKQRSRPGPRVQRQPRAF